MKKLYCLTVVLTIFTIGCADDALQQALLTTKIDGEPSVQTELPDELLAVMHEKIKWQFLDFWTHTVGTDEELQKKWKEHFGDEPIEIIIQNQQSQQKAYYNKYIDAEGIAIVGNEAVEDKHFVNARHIVLAMTAKHPRLRALMQVRYRTPLVQFGFYLILYNPDAAGGVAKLPERYITHQFLKQFPFGWIYGTCYTTFPPNPPNWKINEICYAPIDDFVWSNNNKGEKSYLTTFTHEVAHQIDVKWRFIDVDFGDKLNHAWEVAREKGTWLGLARNISGEYWATGAEVYFYRIGTGKRFETYEAFAEEEPLLFDLLSEVFIPASFDGY